MTLFSCLPQDRYSALARNELLLDRTMGYARFLGSAEAAITSLNAAIEFDIRDFHAKILSATREKLGITVFQSNWEQGKRMPLEEAVAFTLEIEAEQQ